MKIVELSDQQLKLLDYKVENHNAKLNVHALITLKIC